MSSPFLPYGTQNITEEDIEAVVSALRAPLLTTGPKVAEFEEVFANYVGAPNAVAVSNGTAALHLACLALEVGPGDVVLCPSMSFSASTNGAAYTGASVEFMDCDPDTGLVTPRTFVEAANKAAKRGTPAKAAVIVHLNGEHADMALISREAKKRNIHLIEDSCHALGTTYLDENDEVCKVGSCRYSTFSTYSTHPVKTITTGEGGLITTKDVWLAKKLKNLRNHGMERDPENFKCSEIAFDREGNSNPWYYEIQSLGYNYRLTDIACALGISQMQRMHEIAHRRRELKSVYDGKLADFGLPVSPVSSPDGVDAVRHLYPVLIDFEGLGIERSAFCNSLKGAGIGSQVHYIPTHLQPYYRKLHEGLSLPGAERYYDRVLSIPFYPQLTENDVERVVVTIRNILHSNTSSSESSVVHHVNFRGGSAD